MPKQPFVIIPAVGLVVAALAIGFDQITDKGIDEVLFSGQSALPGFVENGGAWSLGTLALLFLCKGLAWSLCLGAFRGGPTFPAMFLGAAGGIAAAHLPGMPASLGIAVGMGGDDRGGPQAAAVGDHHLRRVDVHRRCRPGAPRHRRGGRRVPGDARVGGSARNRRRARTGDVAEGAAS